jgi:hypothetical protein
MPCFRDALCDVSARQSPGGLARCEDARYQIAKALLSHKSEPIPRMMDDARIGQQGLYQKASRHGKPK